MNLKTLAVCLLAPLFFAAEAHAQVRVPEWIWHDNKGAQIDENETSYFRRTFAMDGRAESAGLTATCDNELEIFINGKSIGTVSDWKKPLRTDVADSLKNGDNTIAVRGKNKGGHTAGLLVKLEIRTTNGTPINIFSDTNWVASLKESPGWEKESFAPEDWTSSISLGKLGVEPWGDVFKVEKKVATPAESLTLLPGYKAELIRSAEPGEGSWVCMTVDQRGRLIVSPQENPNSTNGGLLRFTIDRDGKLQKLEKMGLSVGGAQGLLYAFDSLYVNGTGSNGPGLYRLRDTNNDDRFDDIKFLQKFDGRGEHGSHALVAGPDRMLYVMNGNFVHQITNLAPTSPHRNYAEDQLLPRQPDGNGFGNNIQPPGGHLLRTDPEGKKWEIVAAGFRNAYDFALNPDGEFFTYDSDMEWDIGAPWYRPTRLIHVVPGGDYGFREGTGKWPAWYPDSLPALADVGLGSPTGMKFGTYSRFPAKYKRALFALDWAYGRILAVHLTPKGATYAGTFETFISGKPLNVTDMEFRLGGISPDGEIWRDGAMYFITGGRGTQSGLYRVTYTEEITDERPKTKAEIKSDEQAAAARLVRHTLESYAGRIDPKAVDIAWPHLDSDDRWLRYAARMAIESQDIALWKTRALKESKPRASLTTMLALARLGSTNDLPAILKNLQRISYKTLDEPLKLELLRVYGVAFSRLGQPSATERKELLVRLEPLYPALSEVQNRELCQLLVYLKSPTVAAKTMVLLKYAETQQEQMHYVFVLRNVADGWSAADRETYFKWLAKAPKEYKGGNSFKKFIANIKKEAMATLTETETTKLTALLTDEAPTAPKTPATIRPFVREWKMEDLVSSLDQVGKGRSFTKGSKAFTDLMCIQCHRFGNEGGSIGPDITAAASRFSRRDLLEAIIEPSKVISDQYQYFNVTKRNGNEYTGRIAEEDDRKIVLIYNALDPQRVEILKADIERRDPSKVSPMPEGLVNVLTQDEIMDLLAYIESGGKQKSAAFGK